MSRNAPAKFVTYKDMEEKLKKGKKSNSKTHKEDTSPTGDKPERADKKVRFEDEITSKFSQMLPSRKPAVPGGAGEDHLDFWRFVKDESCDLDNMSETTKWATDLCCKDISAISLLSREEAVKKRKSILCWDKIIMSLRYLIEWYACSADRTAIQKKVPKWLEVISRKSYYTVAPTKPDEMRRLPSMDTFLPKLQWSKNEGERFMWYERDDFECNFLKNKHSRREFYLLLRDIIRQTKNCDEEMKIKALVLIKSTILVNINYNFVAIYETAGDSQCEVLCVAMFPGGE